MAAPAYYTHGNFTPATTSLTNSKLKPLNSVLRNNFFEPIISSKTRPFSSLPRLRLCQRKIVSLSQKCSHRLVVAVSAVVDGNSETYPEAEPTDSNAGATIDTKLPRRSLLVEFTCGECGGRTQRLINRLAYERGLVYVQCAGCEKYHKLADNLGLVIEHDLREEISSESNTDQI